MRRESELKNISGDKKAANHLGDRLRDRPPRGRSRVGTLRISVLALAALLCGTGFAYGQNQKNKKDKAESTVTAASLLPDNQAVDLSVSQMLGAWQAGDVEGMRKFYADDVVVISGGWEPPIVGWANYAHAYQAQLARTSGSRLERSNSYIKVTGDTAWVTYQWQYIGNVDGKTAEAFGHSTLVFQKRAGTWLIVLNHTSAIPTDEPPATTSAAPTAGQATSSLAPGR